jgi:hypothetical protein
MTTPISPKIGGSGIPTGSPIIGSETIPQAIISTQATIPDNPTALL